MEVWKYWDRCEVPTAWAGPCIAVVAQLPKNELFLAIVDVTVACCPQSRRPRSRLSEVGTENEIMTQSQLERYHRRGHKNVKGWLEPGAVDMTVALARAQLKMGVAGHIGEIGVYQGRFFILLSLLRRPGEKALALDLFDLGEMYADATTKGDREKMIANLARHANSNEVIIQQADSTELSSSDLISLVGGKFRLISVDGGHTLEVVGNDLATAEGSLAPGGILIQDDFFNEGWPDVATATVRYFS